MNMIINEAGQRVYMIEHRTFEASIYIMDDMGSLWLLDHWGAP